MAAGKKYPEQVYIEEEKNEKYMEGNYDGDADQQYKQERADKRRSIQIEEEIRASQEAVYEKETERLSYEQNFYDALGRITKKTDREGLITEYTYTEDGKIQSILYNDGRMAELEYTPLRQLAVVKDWLGEIRIERDSKGDPLSITDHKGRTVRYEWGSMGQRQGMIYPDGTRISWKRDSLLRPIYLTQTAEGKEPLWIEYKYDKQGYLSEKKSSGGYITKWEYNENGLLDELLHKDTSGILERFCYTYDLMGNRTVIVKERRGLPEESGSYRYSYDALQRLTDVEKDGNILRSYQYDSFGNRTEMVDHVNGVRCMSIYDSLNRLQDQELWEEGDGSGNIIHKSYTYDRRGNLTGEYQEGELLHGYTFDSMNRLQKAWNNQGKETEYIYNALGQRTEKYSGEETEDYLLDLTKSYNNLLGLKKGRVESKFYYDSGVTAMEEAGKMVQYVLSDELGSPLRIVYRNGHGDTYGYDEFGKDLFISGSNQDVKNKYTRQGQRQPFGYTGYRYDDTGETYFAQAREYRPDIGRFTAEDVIKGSVIRPETMNQYKYCFSNPIKYVDFNGKEEDEYHVYYLNNMDGAKVFGHSSILVENIDGTSEFYTYMGTGDTMSALKGEDSLGYMGHEFLTKEETEEFLKTGDIDVKMPGDWYNSDNYDRALKRSITAEEYDQIIATAEYYVKLYTDGNVVEDINTYLQNEPNAIYNLYSHNCDTVAGEILGVVDPYFVTCQEGLGHTTPNDSFYVRMVFLEDTWDFIGVGEMGDFELAIGTPRLTDIIHVHLMKLLKGQKNGKD